MGGLIRLLVTELAGARGGNNSNQNQRYAPPQDQYYDAPPAQRQRYSPDPYHADYAQPSPYMSRREYKAERRVIRAEARLDRARLGSRRGLGRGLGTMAMQPQPERYMDEPRRDYYDAPRGEYNGGPSRGMGQQRQGYDDWYQDEPQQQGSDYEYHDRQPQQQSGTEMPSGRNGEKPPPAYNDVVRRA